jgi:DUF1680 family protein
MSLLSGLILLIAASGPLPVPPVIPDAARPLPLSAVRLTDGPLKHAQDLDAAWLLRLEPARMLAPFRRHAGLLPGAEGYPGWDGPGRNLTGHVLGHYLSAVSLMWAATGDARFKERADTIVRGLEVVQDRNGDGYLGALDGGREAFAAVARGDIRSSSFDLDGLWSPWYTLHKTFAGLRDAWRYTGNRTALDLEVRFASWAEGILSGLSDAQVQAMLNTEFGGMNEVLAQLYEDTGDRRWLDLSYRFEHRAVLDPLKRHQDRLAGLHGNTQVPKLLGSAVRYSLTGDPGDILAAAFFWDEVVQHHSYATGGHGKSEYFGEPDRLSDRVDGQTAETCNVYNMLKLTRRLFALRPDPHYVEFHERALFNHILASMDPGDGRMCYMVPVGRGVQHDYQDMSSSFTCCVGTGMESHALHGDGLYSESKDRLWVNLYVPSTAEWETEGVHLAVDTDFPEGESASLRLGMPSPRAFTLALRRPRWTGVGFAVRVNGEAIPSPPPPESYVELTRTWKAGDVAEVSLPRALHLEPVPDNPRRAAILWGPLVLAGDLGPEDVFPAWRPGAVPALVAAERPVAEWLKPIPGRPGAFRTDGVGREHDVDLVPFYRLHRRTYAIYWDLFTPGEWTLAAAEIEGERERRRRLDEAAVAIIQPGDEELEPAFALRGEETWADRARGRPCRRGKKWFSYEVPVDSTRPVALVITYYQDEWRRRTFDILVDGRKVGEEEIDRGGIPRFFDVEYPVPEALVGGRKTVTVRFEATGGNEIAGVYGIRMIRSGAPAVMR